MNPKAESGELGRSPAVLQRLLGEGLGFRLSDGHIVAGATRAEVEYALVCARAGLGQGTAEDNSSFRNWVAKRAAALGMQPVSWAADADRQGQGGLDNGTTRISRMMADHVDGVRSPASGRPLLLAKSAGGKGKKARKPRAGVAGRVIKSVPAQKFTLQIAYPCDAMDVVGTALDGFLDYAEAATLEKAAWDYLANPDVGLYYAQGTSGAGRVAESHIHRAGPWTVTAVDGSSQTVRNGDWLWGVVWSDRAWSDIVAGRVAGVSVQGSAARVAADAGVALQKGRGNVAAELLAKAAR